MRRLILSFAIIISTLFANAFNYNGLEYYAISSTECEVRGFASDTPIPASARLIIPATASDGKYFYDVTNIAGKAFAGYPEISELVIGPNVETIGANAFSSCIGLTEVIIPSSVKEIGIEAFARCISLNTAVINAETIGVEAFSACYNLVLVQINPGTKYIEPGAFKDCTALPYIDIPFTVEYLGDIPGSVYHDGVFEDCLNLQTVTFTYNLSDKLPRLKSIGTNTFKNCINLQRLDFPYSLTSIGTDSFLRCAELKHLEWGGPSLLKVGSLDLTGVALSRIVFHGDVELYKPYDFEKLEFLKEVRYDKYATKVQGGLFANIPSLKEVHLDNITKIEGDAFKNCTGLVELTLSESITDIEYGAFMGCTSLRSVVLPDALTVISTDLFSNCGALTEITLGNNISFIGRNAFKDCVSLEALELPMSLKQITSNALDGCTSLKSLTMGGEQTLYISNFATQSPIENLALRGDINGSMAWPTLKNVTISDYCTHINSANFYGCSQLASIDLSQITGIGINAFYGCSSLRSLDLTNVSKIGGGAFNNCTSLTDITFGPMLTDLPDCLYNTGIISLIIPDNVLYFRAPKNCPNLKYVKIGNRINYVGDFEQCPALTEMWYGESVNDIVSPRTTLSKITSANPNPPRIGYFSKETYENAQLIVPIGAIDTYRTTSPWLNFKNIAEADLDGIDDACTDQDGLSLTITGNVVSFETAYAATVSSIDGRTIRCFVAGRHEIVLSAGVYIVSGGGKSQKIAVR